MKRQDVRVALVDDHSLLRGSLASLINSFEGYRVIIEADNGEHFISESREKGTPDIVLLDITMPVMNGYETAHWIREHMPSTMILVLSMMDNETAVIAMLKAGAKGYILKDSKPAIFREALNSIRDHGIYLNELVSNRMLEYVVRPDRNGEPDVISQLSEKELQFLRNVCTEMTYKEIAAEMKLSPRTVEGYRDELFRKLNVISRVGLVLFAIRNGIYKL